MHTSLSVIVSGLMVSITSAHLFMPQGIRKIQPFLDESRIKDILIDHQKTSKYCDMADGPHCLGFMKDVRDQNELTSEYKNLLEQNKVKLKTAKETTGHSGMKIADGAALFQLSFFSYDAITSGDDLSMSLLNMTNDT